MSEYERAYAVGPSVELTQKIAEVLLSAGLVDEAEAWLKKGLKLKQPLFDTWMFDPKDRSRQWLRAIEKAKAERPDAAQGAGGK